MLSMPYLDSAEMLQKIDNMIENLDSKKLRSAFTTAQEQFLNTGNKTTRFVRSFKSATRIPGLLSNPPQNLQHFLHNFGDTNIHSLKFFVVITLLNISISDFTNFSKKEQHDLVTKLVANVSERLRLKGYIEFATLDDLPFLENQIEPMLNNLTQKELDQAIRSAEAQYLTGSSRLQYGAQGYAFFGTTNKNLLWNSVDCRNNMVLHTSFFWKAVKAHYRKKYANQTTLAPIQYLQIFLEGPGKKDATSLKLQVVANLLKFSIRNNDDEVATAIINKVIDKLADRRIDSSLDNSALEMSSVQPKTEDSAGDVSLANIIEQILLFKTSATAEELEQRRLKLQLAVEELLKQNKITLSELNKSDASESFVGNNNNSDSDNNNATTLKP